MNDIHLGNEMNDIHLGNEMNDIHLENEMNALEMNALRKRHEWKESISKCM